MPVISCKTFHPQLKLRLIMRCIQLCTQVIRVCCMSERTKCITTYILERSLLQSVQVENEYRECPSRVCAGARS
jgi:hypothetical protein